MKLKWEIDTRDIKKVQQFIHENDNCFVRAVHKRNVVRKGIIINKDQFIKTLIM